MKRKFPFWPVFLSLAAAIGVFAILMPPIPRHHYNADRARCQSSLKHLALACSMYAADADEIFPPVSSTVSGAFGWAGAVEPYVKDDQAFQCVNATSPTSSHDPRSVGYTDYWMNQRLSGAILRDLPQPALTILHGEGNDGTDATDARYALDSLPASWLKDPSSPPFRHLEGANYAFADGHVKWLQHQRMEGSTKPKSDGNYTFAIK